MSKLEDLRKKREELAKRKQELLVQKSLKDKEKEKKLKEELMLNTYQENEGWQEWFNKNGFGTEAIKCYDIDIDVKIPKLMGSNTIVNKKDWVAGTNDYENNLYVSYIKLNKEGKREVTANIKTFIGMSFDAIHYYAKLEAYGVNWRKYNDKEDDVFRSWNMVPGYLDNISIEITKKLTKEEKEHWPRRWQHYRVGDDVVGFEDFDELKEKINYEFERIFGSDDWCLKIEE